MKRSIQEIVELVVFGLVALLIGTGLLWVGGWALDGLGWLLKFIAGLLWMLLKYIVPVAIAAGLVYWLVRFLMSRNAAATGTGDTPAGSPAAAAGGAPLAEGADAAAGVPAEAPVADAPVPGAMPVSDSWHDPVPEVDTASSADLDAAAEPPAEPQAPVDPVQPAEPMPPVEPDVPVPIDPATRPVTNPPIDPPMPDDTATVELGHSEDRAGSEDSAESDEDSPLRNG